MRFSEDETEVQSRRSYPIGCKSYSWRRYAKTVALIYSWISLGLYSEILGPTLPTLMNQTQSNYEQVGSALSIRSVGLLSGSLVGGLASDRWKKQRAFLVALALILAALSNTIIPWLRTIPGLSATFYMAGFSHGFLTTSGNPLLGSVWGSHASGPFSLMHAGYGLGAAIAPILVAPFTIPSEGNYSEKANNNETLSSLATLATNVTESAIIQPLIPYNVVALVLVLSALCFIPFSGITWESGCYKRDAARVSRRLLTQETQTSRSTNQPLPLITKRIQRIRSTLLRVTRHEIFLTISVFIIYFAVVGNERVFGKFMFAYAIYGPVQMGTRRGYTLHLAYWICFGIARVLTCCLSFLISAQLMLSLLVVGTLVASVGLILIPQTPNWFFAFTCLFSLFKSPLFPGTLAAINLSYEITGLLVLVINLGSACGASLLQYTAGRLIQGYGQYIFPYLVCGSACVVLFTAIGLLLVLRAMGNRFDSEPMLKTDPVDSLIPSNEEEIVNLHEKSLRLENVSTQG